MPSGGVFLGGRSHARLWVWGGLLVAIGMLALWPYAFVLRHYAAPVVLAAAIVGYLPRGRTADALWLAVPAAAVGWVEPGTATRVFVLLALPWFVLTKRARFAAAVSLGFMALLLVGSELKLRFAGSRLTWQDVRFFFLELHDNAGVFATQPTLLLYASAVLLALVALLWASWRWDGRTREPVPRRGPPGAAAALALVVFATSANAVVADASWVRSIGPWNGDRLTRISAFPFAYFLHTARLRTEWTEPSVDTTAFAKDVLTRAGAVPTRDPADIVLFLQESQFNPALVQDCPPEDCAMPVFAADAATVAHGALRVHTFGGGTWLSEFAVASGVPHTSFGDAGDYAPFTVAPGIHRSLPRSLRAAGYRTVAIYPVDGGMMNARKAYGAYGYDAFYDPHDLGFEGGYKVTDHEMHAAAMRVLERERMHGKPVLLTVVTIFNHSEHGVHLERVPPDLLARMRTRFGDRQTADVLADYVWRTGEFQAAMQHTQEVLLRGPRPAVLAWFGDHQPAAAARLKVRPADGSGRAPAQYQTWYRVSSNVRNTPRTAAPAPLDIAFLPGLLAQAAGAPLDEMLSANVTAREECGGLLRECARPQVRDGYFSYLRQNLRAFELP